MSIYPLNYQAECDVRDCNKCEIFSDRDILVEDGWLIIRNKKSNTVLYQEIVLCPHHADGYLHGTYMYITDDSYIKAEIK